MTFVPDASKQESGESFPWLKHYLDLMETTSPSVNPFLVNEHHFATISGSDDVSSYLNLTNASQFF